MDIIENGIKNLHIHKHKKQKKINIYKKKWKKIIKRIKFKIKLFYLRYINRYYIDYLEQKYNILL